MSLQIQNFIQKYLRKNTPDLRPGDVIRVHQKIKEKKGERIQIFEGVIIAKKHGTEVNSTITVRKVIAGVGVEKIFPIHSPNVTKIEVVKRSKVRRAKLYFLRDASERKARLKRKEFEGIAFEEKEETPETPKEFVEEIAPEVEASTEEVVEEKKEEAEN